MLKDAIRDIDLLAPVEKTLVCVRDWIGRCLDDPDLLIAELKKTDWEMFGDMVPEDLRNGRFVLTFNINVCKMELSRLPS
jgi:hypothetical protein